MKIETRWIGIPPTEFLSKQPVKEEQKQCACCLRMHPLSFFQSHTGTKDKLRAKCKECVWADTWIRKIENPERAREHNHNRHIKRKAKEKQKNAFRS